MFKGRVPGVLTRTSTPSCGSNENWWTTLDTIKILVRLYTVQQWRNSQ